LGKDVVQNLIELSAVASWLLGLVLFARFRLTVAKKN
jgi:hypothetical protein